MKKIRPTDAELEILGLLWNHGPSTVKQINDLLNSEKEVGYTTTLKIMQIMFDKKILKREKLGRSHIYDAAMKKSDTQGVLLEKFLKTTFSGSASKLVMQAIGRENTTQKEIDEIKNFLEKLEKDQNGNK